MFQNKGENKSRLVIPYKIIIFALLNQNAMQTISNHIGYFVSIHTVKFNCVEFGSGNARRLAF